MAPESRALGSALLVLLSLDGRQLEDFLARYGRELDASESSANTRVRQLRDGPVLERHLMLEAYEQLAPPVRHAVAEFVIALREREMARAGSAGAQAWDLVDRSRREHKESMVRGVREQIRAGRSSDLGESG